MQVIQLGPSKGVTGTYEQSAERIRLDGVHGEEVAFAQIDWALETGVLGFGSGTILRGARFDFVFDRAHGAGFVGSVKAASAVSPTVAVRVGQVEVTGELELVDIAYSRAASGAWSVSAKDASLKAGTVRFGEMHAEVGSLSLKGVRLVSENDTLALETHALEIDGTTMHIGPFVVALEGLSVPRGIRLANGLIEVAEASAKTVRFEVPDLRDLVPDEPPEPPRLNPETKSGTAPFDLSFVDGLQGEINLDLMVDAKLSVVRRKKTHEFRIALVGGEINVQNLERDLGTLENAFIDIGVRDGKLSIENDIPLLPGYYRSLVHFRLPEDEVARVDETKWVKLRHLAEWELPKSDETKKPKKSSKSPFELKALDFDNINVNLRLERPSRIDLQERGIVQLGLDADRPPLESFSLTGDVKYRPEETPTEGHLNAVLVGLHLALERLRVGTREVSIGEAHLGRVEPAIMRFLGAHPDHLEMVFHEVSISKVLAAPAPMPEQPEPAAPIPEVAITPPAPAEARSDAGDADSRTSEPGD